MLNVAKPESSGKRTIALRIKAVMSVRDLTMRTLSTRTGIPYGTLEGYLRGRHPMSASAIGLISEVLEVSADWLLLGRPATFDNHCLALAITHLQTLIRAAESTGHEMSALSKAQVFSDIYSELILRAYDADTAEGSDDADQAKTDPSD